MSWGKNIRSVIVFLIRNSYPSLCWLRLSFPGYLNHIFPFAFLMWTYYYSSITGLGIPSNNCTFVALILILLVPIQEYSLSPPSCHLTQVYSSFKWSQIILIQSKFCFLKIPILLILIPTMCSAHQLQPCIFSYLFICALKTPSE